jgi:ubiquinone/menaquinone biosynthesis C-methylase UbiE
MKPGAYADAMHPSQIRRPTDVLADTVELAGRDVLDVGCGEGALVRWIRSLGGRVIGAECGDEMRRRAVLADPEHADDYVDAEGQQLPFDDATFDLVIYSYSLHHVPVADLPAALDEARRVLRPGGILYVVEPDVDAPATSVAYPVVDETEVRTAAQHALGEASRRGFVSVDRFTYDSETVHPDFESYACQIVGIDPDRSELLVRHRDEVSRRFHELGERRPEGWAFRRRNLVCVLRT